jgi:hypothetical protein
MTDFSHYDTLSQGMVFKNSANAILACHEYIDFDSLKRGLDVTLQ